MAKILIVDDDPDVVDATRTVLEAEGHTVLSASNRERGMEAAKADTPDLLILDVMMEEADDGLKMAQALKRDGFASPVLMLSSIGKVSGLDYGKDNDMVPVDEFVEKPVDPDVLVATVKKLLG